GILSFSRSGLGERIPVNIQSVVEETLELLEASLPKGIRLEKRLEASNAAVIGDATRLHQVAMNLYQRYAGHGAQRWNPQCRAGSYRADRGPRHFTRNAGAGRVCATGGRGYRE